MTATVPVVLELAERDYLYGTGPLRLQVQHVEGGPPLSYDGDDWYAVTGVQLARTGAALRPVQVLVRGRRIPPALRG